MAARVPQRQPGEHATRLRVPERRPLAGEVRQEDEAVGAGRGVGRLGQEGVGGDRAAQDVVSVPVEGPAGGRHRRPDAVVPGERGRRDESARHLHGPVPIDPEAARGPARVEGIAGSKEPRAVIAGEGIDRATRDRDPGGQAERIRRRTG